MMKRSVQTCILAGFLAILCLCGFLGNSAKAEANQNDASNRNHEVVEETEPVSPGVDEMDLEPEIVGAVNLDSELLPDRPTTAGEQETVMGEIFAAERPYLIGIDPGHLGYTGGEKKWFNTGAVSEYSGKVEYEFTLEVALCLKEELVSRGYDVYLVRDTNVQKEYPYDYGQRAEAINQMGCDIMIGIHWDSYTDGKVGGYHVIYQEGNDLSYEYAKFVDKNYGKVVSGTIKQRYTPVGRDDLWELNAVTMPGIFVECGFASNVTEAKWLEDKDNQELIAYGIADGIDEYFEYVEANYEELKAAGYFDVKVEEPETEEAETETETEESD